MSIYNVLVGFSFVLYNGNYFDMARVIYVVKRKHTYSRGNKWIKKQKKQKMTSVTYIIHPCCYLLLFFFYQEHLAYSAEHPLLYESKQI